VKRQNAVSAHLRTNLPRDHSASVSGSKLLCPAVVMKSLTALSPASRPHQGFRLVEMAHPVITPMDDMNGDVPQSGDMVENIGASGRSPAKTLSMIRRRARVHGRRLAWRFGWQRSGDRSVLGCAVRAAGGVAEPQRARV
jgi:hypothetical protein